MSGRCLHRGAGLSMPPLHPGFLAMVAVTSPLFWAAAGGSLPPGDCPAPDLQPSPSPESHNLVRSLPDLTGTGKAALGPRGKAKVPGRHTAAYEGLRGVGASPSQISGHFFQMAPRDHHARAIRKGGVGTDHFLSSKQGCGWSQLDKQGGHSPGGRHVVWPTPGPPGPWMALGTLLLSRATWAQVWE